jgi:hypothetical protein
MRVQVFDKDTLSDDFLGESDIDLNQLGLDKVECMYECVCMYVYILYVRVCTYECVCMYVYILYVRVCTYACVCICVYILYVRVCTYECVCICVYILYVRVCTYVSCMHVYVCTYISCMCVYVRVLPSCVYLSGCVNILYCLTQGWVRDEGANEYSILGRMRDAYVV